MLKKGAIGVGLGVTPGRSWATMSHIPALRALPEYEIVAVANSTPESSEAAAKAFGTPHPHPDAAALAKDSDVDLVAITVKSPPAQAIGPWRIREHAECLYQRSDDGGNGAHPDVRAHGRCAVLVLGESFVRSRPR